MAELNRERVTLAKIDFSVDEAVSNLQELGGAIADLKKKNSALKKDNQEASAEFQTNAVRLKQLTTEYKVQQKVLTDFTNDFSKFDDVITETDGSIKSLEGALRRNKELFRRLTKEERDNTKQGKELLATIKAQDKEYKELQTSIGTTQVNVGNYEEAIRNALSGQQLFGDTFNTTIVQLNSFKTALTSVQNTFIGVSKAQDVATASTTRMSKAMRVLRAALISTGVGALIVALGSLVAVLSRSQKFIDFVRKATQSLQAVFLKIGETIIDLGQKMFGAFDSPREAIKGLGKAIVTNLLNRFKAIGKVIDAVGKGFKALVKRDFEGVKEASKELGQAITQAVTGLDEKQQAKVVKGARDIGKSFRDTAKDAFNLEGALADLEKQEARLEVKREKSRATIKDLNKLAEDTTKSNAERAKAAEQAISIEQSLLKEQEEIARKRLQTIKEQNALNNTNEADLQRERDAEIALARTQQESLELQTTLQNKLNTINQQSATTYKKTEKEKQEAIEETTEKIQEQFDEQDDALEDVLSRSEDFVAVEKELFQKRIDAVNVFGLEREDLTEDQLKALEILEKEHQERLAKIRLDELAKSLKEESQARVVATAENTIALNKELQAVGDNEEKKKEIKARYRLEELEDQRSSFEQQLQLIQAELARQEGLTASINEDGASLSDSVLSEEQLAELQSRFVQLQALISGLTTQIGEQKEEITQGGETSWLQDIFGISDEQNEKIALGFQAAIEGANLLLNTAQEGLEIRTNKQIAELDRLRASDTISQAEYDKRKEKIERKSFERGKKIQATLATISFAQGLINILTAQSTIPQPFDQIFKALATAQLVATYGIQLAKIRSAQFEQGGLLKGASHNQGGIPFTIAGRAGFEAEGGEFIVNKRATKKHLPILRAINDSTLSSTRQALSRAHFQDGGIVSRQITRTVNNSISSSSSIREVFTSDEFADKLAESVSSLPAPVLNIVELNDEQDRQTQIQELTQV